ncbi:MAG: glycoside hydrolase family 31 protein [Clostridia bacterium]|nr:glycoside hydrolase family 31 protein [Clostridia bacterium]
MKLFKISDNIYGVRENESSDSMLSRYGILTAEGVPCKTSEAVSVTDGKIIFTAKRKLEVEVEKKSMGYTLRIPLSERERIFGLADSNRENVMIRGMQITIWKENVKCYGGMPILLSSDGWAMLLNTTYKTEFDIGKTSPDEISVRVHGGEVDIYLFRQDTLLGLTKEITSVTGRPMMLPKFAYGLTVVNNEAIGIPELLEYTRLFREYDIPCDCMGLEPYWMNEYYDFSTDKEWNKEKFYIPYWQPKNTSAQGTFFHPMRRMGMQLSLWLCEDYDLIYEEEKAAPVSVFNGFHEDAEILDKHLSGTAMYQDKITRIGEKWFDHLEKFVDNCAAAFKLDASNQVFEHPDRLWGGKYLDREVHNAYPVILAKQMMEGFREYTGRRIMTNTSCAYVGTQRYAATWAGDTGGGPKTLVSVMNYAFCGHSNTGCDIDVNSLSSMHYGFLMPWTQQNNWAYWNYPWYLGEELLERYRFYSKLRSSLFPYLYYAAYQAHRDGVPMLRPLSMLYPETDRYDSKKNEYMLGDSLLVGAFDMHISLPEGRWTDYFTGETYEGGGEIEYTPPKGIGGALLVKEGALIVTMRPQKYLLEREHEYTVNIYPSAESGETYIYEDDGYTFDYETGGCALTKIHSSGIKDSTLTLTVSKREGSYDGRPDNGHDIRSNSIPRIEGIKPEGDLTVAVRGVRIREVRLEGEAIEFTSDNIDSFFTVQETRRAQGELRYEIFF